MGKMKEYAAQHVIDDFAKLAEYHEKELNIATYAATKKLVEVLCFDPEDALAIITRQRQLIIEEETNILQECLETLKPQ